MPKYKVRKVAVLGAGVMGSRIAAHFANAGFPSLLFDIVPGELLPEEAAKGLTIQSPQVRNRIVNAGWRAALQGKPPALFEADMAARVTPGNLEDHLSRIEEADWIIEAVTERLDIKCALLAEVEKFRRPGTIVSTNTSGIRVSSIAAGFGEDFRRNFLGTHFFNPPRYLKLLELIPTPETDPELVAFLREFGETALGKGIVLCKDTPNFIANRIGTYGACLALQTMLEEGLTIEEVDLLTGTAIGRPKSATFRTFDVVGLDTFAHVARNLYDGLPEDPEREVFRMPPFVETMIQRRWLGDKTGQGFYRKIRGKGGSEILFLDPASLDYRPLQTPRFDTVEKAKRLPLEQRIRKLVQSRDRAGRFLWRILSSTLCYAAQRIPEISDDILSVDRAMRWGFLHSLGPFETWDALGVRRVIGKLSSEGRPVPPLVESLVSSGGRAFYRRRAGRQYYFDPSRRRFARQEERPGIIVLRALKERSRVIRENPGASLIDIGDGVACLEFHTKMNAIDGDILRLTHEAADEVSRNFAGLVIANEGDNFSVGANLVEVLGAARSGRWDAIDQMIRAFQNANLRLGHCDKPVVAAPHHMALGGGCEIVLHCDRVHAAAELYIGFAEVGVGLIPAAGGCKEMAARAFEAAGSPSDMQLFPRIQKAFELIGMARISSSAREALSLGLLRPGDSISVNADRRIALAKEDVLALARGGYRPPFPRRDIRVLGRAGMASLKLGLHMMERGGYISEYDKAIGTKLATVLCGGDLPGMQPVGEQHLLDLEREAFLSLCGEPKTQQRMEHMLKTGKPLRN